MLLKILRFIFGYIKVEVNGFAPERFMNLLINNDIVVWDVITTPKGYIFYSGRNNLLKMKPFLQKTNVKMHILSKHGLPYIIKRNQKRCFLFLGFLLCVFGVYTMSLFVWEVKVTGEKQLISANLIKEIETEYVPLGTRIREIDCNDLERLLRDKHEEISWISCSIHGTTLMISLEEGTASQDVNDNLENCDLVATKDATITKMITREGTPVKKVNEKVKKGDILISGTVYIYDDYNEVLETEYVAADGDVYGSVNEPYEDYEKLNYYKKQYEEKETVYYTFFIFKYCFTPFVPKVDEKNTDCTSQVHKARIFKDFYLPFGIRENRIRTYKLVKEKHSKEEAGDILKKRLDEKIAYLKEKGVEIIQNNVKIELKKNEGIMKATGYLTVNESIAGVQELTAIPESTHKQEES